MKNYQNEINNRKEKKPLHVYERLLLALYACIGAGLSHAETANTLNEAGLLTITGRKWTKTSVQVTLHRLNRNEPGHLTAAKDVLVASGKLSAELIYIAKKDRRKLI